MFFYLYRYEILKTYIKEKNKDLFEEMNKNEQSDKSLHAVEEELCRNASISSRTRSKTGVLFYSATVILDVRKEGKFISPQCSDRNMYSVFETRRQLVKPVTLLVQSNAEQVLPIVVFHVILLPTHVCVPLIIKVLFRGVFYIALYCLRFKRMMCDQFSNGNLTDSTFAWLNVFMKNVLTYNQCYYG